MSVISATGYDLDDAPNTLIGAASGDVSVSLVNAPITIRSNFLCRTYAILTYKIQIYIAYSKTSSILRVFMRQSAPTQNVITWSGWKEFTLTDLA